ncbi:biopolymer transporter ExbD [cyanobacterium TDX16]|nr:biopolymer transporter ExbD [cyanobacterium TDX16]
MKINLHSPIEEVQVQIIPLIDVIFCILTFFLLAALQFTRQQAIEIQLPKASTGTAPMFQSRLIVTLKDGQLYVEKEPVQIDKLTQTLKAYTQANPLGTIILNASRSSSYNDVIQLLDIMRQIGGDRVALATTPGSPDLPSGSNLSSPDLTPLAPINPNADPRLNSTAPIAPQLP